MGSEMCIRDRIEIVRDPSDLIFGGKRVFGVNNEDCNFAVGSSLDIYNEKLQLYIFCMAPIIQFELAFFL